MKCRTNPQELPSITNNKKKDTHKKLLMWHTSNGRKTQCDTKELKSANFLLQLNTKIKVNFLTTSRTKEPIVAIRIYLSTVSNCSCARKSHAFHIEIAKKKSRRMRTFPRNRQSSRLVVFRPPKKLISTHYFLPSISSNRHLDGGRKKEKIP